MGLRGVVAGVQERGSGQAQVVTMPWMVSPEYCVDVVGAKDVRGVVVVCGEEVSLLLIDLPGPGQAKEISLP